MHFPKDTTCKKVKVRRMKTSPIYPRNEAGNHYGYEFDPQADFAQFLEEARKHTCDEGTFMVASRHTDETRKTQSKGEKNNRKSWKGSLFSWLKTDKKGKNLAEPLQAFTIPKLRRGIVSGPIHGSSAGFITGKPRKPTSGPLMSLFNPAKKEEDGMPYMCLSHPNSHQDAQPYGPVYLVT